MFLKNPFLYLHIIYQNKGEAEVNIIKSGMKLIEDSAKNKLNGKYCIKFVPQTKESTWLQIKSENGCFFINFNKI